MSNLLIRVISAAVVVLLMIGTYMTFRETGLYLLGVVVLLIGSLEYYRMMIGPASNSKVIAVSFFVTAVCVILPVQLLFTVTYALVLLPILLTITLWVTRSKIENTKLLSLCFAISFGVFYCMVFPKLILSVILEDEGLQKFSGFLLLVFSNDIFAYFGGMTFGKTPLMPSLSPKKTVEGAICGCIGAAITTFAFFSVFTIQGFSPVIWLLAALPIAFVAQAGDLLISLLKRVSGVKDSGKIMPGHGGVLDRLDAVLFAAPLYATTLFLLNT